MAEEEKEIIEDLEKCKTCIYRNNIEKCLCEVKYDYKNKVLNLIEKLKKENEEKDKEIEFWKEQAEGYQGLSQQIKEDYNTF